MKNEKIVADDCVVMPHQSESRNIYAESDLEILAVQGLKIMKIESTR